MTMDELLKHEIDGCLTCGLYVKVATFIFGSMPPSDAQFVVRTSFNRGLKGLEVELTVNGISQTLELCRLLGPSNVSKAREWGIMKFIPEGLLLPKSTRSEDTFQQIRTWIKECKTQHSKQECRSYSETTLPNRIVVIGKKPDDPVSLWETQGACGRYSCLSWCWGRATSFKTTRQNLSSHKIQIPWAQIPPTFQNAIEISRRLDIHYIWIDALCIVQDDKEDWERESGMMAEVYGKSFITICSLAGTDSLDTIFNSLPEDFIQQPLGDMGEILIRTPMRHGAIAQLPGLKPDVEDSRRRAPLFWRAWAFQEMLLSRRVLFFGRFEVTWRCSSLNICNCCASPFAFLEQSFKFFNNIWQFQELDQLTTQQRKVLWYRLVEQYSTKELTKLEDTLPALSGIAQRFQSIRKCRYLAGLWEDNLIEDLCWEHRGAVDHSFNVIRSAKLVFDYVAPSWSWAAHFQPIIYRHEIGCVRQRVNIQSIFYKTGSTDPTGQVEYAYLKIRGHLIELYFGPDYINDANRKQFLEWPNGPRCHRQSYFISDYHPTVLRRMFTTKSKIFALPLVTYIGNGMRPLTALLILQHEEGTRTIDNSLQTFRRIGFLRTYEQVDDTYKSKELYLI
ncbi:heterokaryon incompatibility protein-domain-containing protein [Xylaria flabelliformis]|nr:heterokaryon incompatibility protein-domain-containing protein [Xylaria flabelliformis]